MSTILCLTLIVVLLVIDITTAQDICCFGEDQCKDSTRTCPIDTGDDVTCRIDCRGNVACGGGDSFIGANIGSTAGTVEIYCIGEDACIDTTFNCRNVNCAIICCGKAACKAATVLTAGDSAGSVDCYGEDACDSINEGGLTLTRDNSENAVCPAADAPANCDSVLDNTGATGGSTGGGSPSTGGGDAGSSNSDSGEFRALIGEKVSDNNLADSTHSNTDNNYDRNYDLNIDFGVSTLTNIWAIIIGVVFIIACFCWFSYSKQRKQEIYPPSQESV